MKWQIYKLLVGTKLSTQKAISHLIVWYVANILADTQESE